MTGGLSVSLIVVSRHRPADLARCVAAIRKLDHPLFELIIVTDPGSVPLAGDARVVVFDDANISAARNAGLAVAAGQIVVFIDDDAVPEPRWLSRLTAPFVDPAVAAAGGFVIGRNGISFQWKASEIDCRGRSHPKDIDESRPAIQQAAPGRAIKTEGTNCAFRRDVLAALGGFDPVFRFYLDEADVNLRLAAAGHATAIVPAARVHHGYAASSRRRADRVPTDLTEIAASQMAFLRKHAPASDHADALSTFLREQGDRVTGHRTAGRIDADQADRLMDTLKSGLSLGAGRPLLPLPPIGAASDFRHFPPGSGRIHHMCGWTWQANELRAATARTGDTTVLFLFSPTTLYHKVHFTGTHWEQRGGLFGRADRSDPVFRPWRLQSRARHEANRLDF